MVVTVLAPASALAQDAGQAPSGPSDEPTDEAPSPTDESTVGDAPEPTTDELPAAIGRISGENRYETAAMLSTVFDEAGTVFVASGQGFADALAGGPIAALEDAPILLVSRDAIPAATSDALDLLEPAQIVVLGGTAAVSNTVADELEAWAPVERVAGRDRYETAAVLAARGFPNGARGAIVATGAGFADALSGATRGSAFSDPMPVLLVRRDGLPDVTRTAIEDLAPEVIAIMGGVGSVSDDVEDELGGLAADVERFGGSNRYETSAMVAELYDGAQTQVVFVSTGSNFPDALAAAPVVGYFDGPTLLVPSQGDLPEETKDALRRFSSVQYVIVVGGPGAVPDDVMDEIGDVVNTEA
jgi:putative cell wall-binding protein